MQELIERAARDLIDSQYAIALTGAGISTESGIPDYRGPSGIWTKNPDAEQKAYQSYPRFLEDPKEYWKERLSGTSVWGDLSKVHPNAGHCALAELETLGILKWVITQNVDNLLQRAGSRNVLDYHGNAFKLRCIDCNSRFNYGDYNLEVLREHGELPPRCKRCGSRIKPDLVHFGEPIPKDVARQSIDECLKSNVVLVCGTSAVVFPFTELPRVARQRSAERGGQTQSGLHGAQRVPRVTVIEVNATSTPLTEQGISDYLIRGRTGEVLPKIVSEIRRLKWDRVAREDKLS
jgi:NAD-dependent deacetylase